MNTQKVIHPAYAYIGAATHTKGRAQQLIRAFLCSTSGCLTCLDCQKIELSEHPAVSWLVPEQYYTLGQVETIFKTIMFQLQPEQHHFFVLERADLLHGAPAHKLLKSLEEPPSGYHFILLSSHKAALLPTLLSRCIVEYCSTDQHEYTSLLAYFMALEINRAHELPKELEKSKISERDIGPLLDSIFAYWLSRYKKALEQEKHPEAQYACQILEVITRARDCMPMPGSAKVYLKNLFMQCLVLTNSEPIKNT